MSIIKTDSIHYENIASKIREKTNSTNGYKPSDMASGVDEVYEQGKKAEHDAFWGIYVYPNADDIDYMFAGPRWTNTLFKPPAVTLKPTRRAMYMFARSGIKGDLAQIFNDLGFYVDFSECVYINQIFNNSLFTRIGELNFSNATSDASAVFINSAKLVTIDKIIVGSKTKYYTNWFAGCTALENVTFDGVIDKNIDFKDCTKLTKASIMSIYYHLMPETEFTVTFSKVAVNKAFETSEGANDGSDSAEWEELISRLPDITFSLI